MIDERVDHFDVDLLHAISEAIVRNAYFNITERREFAAILAG